MKIRIRRPALSLTINRQSEYPMLGIAAAMLLIYLSPFTGSLTSYVAFLICLYRVFRYNARIFATDYCLLIPLVQIFCTTGRMSFFIYLCLLAAIWFFVKTGIRSNASYILLILLLNYLLARMQMNIANFFLCFGQLCVLCIVLPEQDRHSAIRTMKLFCIGVLLSSAYALIFRNAWQLRSLLGTEDEAIWGTGIRRFYGLYRDPNYYATLLILGFAILSKLKNLNEISTSTFVTMCLCMALFGLLTYSKMFLLTSVLFAVAYVVWRFREKKYFWGIFLTIGGIAAVNMLLSLDIGILEVLLDRFRRARTISELTTGRTDVYVQYLSVIMQNSRNFFFGIGLGEEGLYKDAHNLCLEVTYYIGIVGLLLMLTFFGSVAKEMKKRAENDHKQNSIEKYLPLVLMAVLYCSLHGMFQIMFYGGMFVALLTIAATREPEMEDVGGNGN